MRNAFPAAVVPWTIFPLTAVLMISLSGLALAQSASLTPIAGTRVSLRLPEGFQVADRFAGIVRRDVAALVMVAELPTPSAKVLQGLSREALAARGMTLGDREEVTSAMGEATLLHVTQSTSGQRFSKWILVAGDGATSVMLTAHVPAEAAGALEATLRQVLLTATWKSGAVVDPTAGVPFIITESDELRRSRAVTGGAVATSVSCYRA